MEKTTRRNLLKVAAASGVSAALVVATKTEARAQQSSAPDETQRHGHLDMAMGGTHQPGTLAISARRQTPPRMVATFPEATVSFGYFPADATVDRMQVVNPGNRNGHQMIPNQVTIRAGGMVNFIIAGNHQVVVYDDGIQPRNINADLVLPPPLNNLIDDPNGRVYTLNSLAGRLLPSANASESTAWLRSGQSFKLRSSEAVPVTSYTRLQPTRTVTSKY